MRDNNENNLLSALKARVKDEILRELIADLTGKLSGDSPENDEETATVVAGTPVRKEKNQRGAFSKIRECISPRCKKISKGPRFRYLCENHIDTPLKQVEKWRETRPERKPDW